ncbi:alkaline phosphatase-like [Macrosteles quadrilineatus]|uniref:alkaline phosphatase-like n=1 Tax=Macrosteles quadrilineatus TaxID=74068 RepID=UPI0023E146BE|nr:alkaline phosphatase-like [Macrosteles quadrilineatus]XP_054283875.1 alkaline phosphatase-like [Macrosteles quadrilineatus]
MTSQLNLQLLLYLFVTFSVSGQDYDRDYWFSAARATLDRRLLETHQYKDVAKNIVLMVGDGLGLPTLTAARIFKGQRHGRPGESGNLAWDNFPALALAKTYNLDAQVGESSACATALLCGVKANLETVGLDVRGKFGNCTSSFISRVDSLLDWAQQEGKATGLVTNTRVSHATPAALYAHSASRYWEDDSKVPENSRKSCKDIARQLVEDDPGRHIHVVMGGGRRHWLPKVSRDPEPDGQEGRRLDGRNLIDDWLRDKRRRGLRAEYVWNTRTLDKLQLDKVDRLLGLFSYSHMEFEANRNVGPEGDPSLPKMTRTALKILTRNPRGFFLFVESGRIDHAHHYNNPYRALDETLMLEESLLEVLSVVDPSETLIVVTSDHSHVLSFGGLNTPIGNPILGADTSVSDVDGRPYSTLLYGNGPGHASPRTDNSSGVNAVHGSAAPRQWATHGGEDVPVYAQGPQATMLFTGTVDQSFIPHAVAYSACLGEQGNSKRCQRRNETKHGQTGGCESPEVNTIITGSKTGGGRMLASSVLSDSAARGATSILSMFLVIDFIFYSNIF